MIYILFEINSFHKILTEITLRFLPEKVLIYYFDKHFLISGDRSSTVVKVTQW